MATQPLLEGIRVVDFTTSVSGPYASAILADLGCEVIKVEMPKTGDPLRHWPPLYTPERSAFFVALNRNKKGITLNLSDPAAQQVALDLIRTADVVMENFKPGAADRLSVGFDAARTVNPHVVYASISGFGQTGPLSGQPCFDTVAEALSGLMSINGYPDRPPLKVAVDVTDMTSGMYAVIGILAALSARTEDSPAQHVDVSMLDTGISLLEQAIPTYAASHTAPERMGSESPTGSPNNVYQTKDGYLVMAAGPQRQFASVCQLAGRPDMATDPRFSSMAGRNVNRAEVNAMVAAWTATVTTEEACTALAEAGVVSAPVLTIPEMLEHPQVKHRGSVIEFDDPVVGKATGHLLPIRFSDAPVEVRTPAPVLGGSNREVLEDLLGYDAERIEELAAKGIF
jgi:crotonobetainyl-CoA:carnitine CoA-transferase CaiB-like acyl-CoA transferase